MVKLTQLKRQVELLNTALEKAGSSMRAAYEGRNGYRAIDMYEEGACSYTLITGTTGECSEALHIYRKGWSDHS